MTLGLNGLNLGLSSRTSRSGGGCITLSIANATYNDNFLDLSSLGQVGGLTGKPDGTKLYLCRTGNDTIYEIDFGTGGDITTASIGANSPAVTAVEGNPQALAISPDGNYMYVGGFISDNINQINLTTPYRVTAFTNPEKAINLSSYGNNYSPASSVSNNGATLLALTFSPTTIRQFTMSDITDVSTASEDASLNVSGIGGGSGTSAGFMNEAATVWLHTEGVNDILYELSGDALGTFSLTGETFDYATVLGETHCAGLWCMSTNGVRYDRMYLLGRTSGKLFEIEL